MLTYINPELFRVGGWVGDYLKYSPVAAKILLWCWKTCGKIWKSTIVFNVYKQVASIFWYDKNTVRTTSKSTICPIFYAPFKTWRFPPNHHRLLLYVALSRWDFSTFTWLYVNVLTKIVLISRSLFDIVEPEVSFWHWKNSYIFIKLF